MGLGGQRGGISVPFIVALRQNLRPMAKSKHNLFLLSYGGQHRASFPFVFYMLKFRSWVHTFTYSINTLLSTRDIAVDKIRQIFDLMEITSR